MKTSKVVYGPGSFQSIHCQILDCHVSFFLKNDLSENAVGRTFYAVSPGLSSFTIMLLLLYHRKGGVSSIWDALPWGPRISVPSIQWTIKNIAALASVAQLVGHCPANQKVKNLIPRKGTCLGCGLAPHLGCIQEATNRCFSLTSMFLSLSPSLPLL